MSSKEENKQLQEENEDEDEDGYYDQENKNEYEYEYENKNEYECEYENKNEYEYENDDKTIDQNKIKGLNDYLDEIIDKSKSFEEQIKSLKIRKDLEGFYPYNNLGDKELKSKYFKIELAKLSNDIDEKLFEEIFGHTLIKLTDILINTTNKEKNQIIVGRIKKSKNKLSEMKDYSNEWVIQSNNQRINLLNTIDLILKKKIKMKKKKHLEKKIKMKKPK